MEKYHVEIITNKLHWSSKESENKDEQLRFARKLAFRLDWGDIRTVLPENDPLISLWEKPQKNAHVYLVTMNDLGYQIASLLIR